MYPIKSKRTIGVIEQQANIDNHMSALENYPPHDLNIVEKPFLSELTIASEN